MMGCFQEFEADVLMCLFFCESLVDPKSRFFFFKRDLNLFAAFGFEARLLYYYCYIINDKLA